MYTRDYYLFIFLLVSNYNVCYSYNNSVDLQNNWSIWDLVKKNLFYIYTLQSPVVKNEMCRKQSDFYNEQLFEGSMFAAKMLDSSSKIQNGILDGSFADIGQFDECLNVYSETPDSGELHGKYCLAKFKIKPTNRNMTAYATMQKLSEVESGTFKENDMASTSLTTRWAICVPAVCPTSDVEAHLQYTLEHLFNSIKGVDVKVSIQESDCQDKTTIQPKIEPLDWFVIILFSLIGLLIIVSTCYDFYAEDKKVNNIFLVFSVRKNYNELISVNRNPDHFHCLNGIRWFSMMWVVLGHRYTVELATPIANSLVAIDWLQRFSSGLIIGATVSVDTFFVMSGVLLMFSVMKLKARKISFNVPMFYLHRYLRLTPSLLALLFFYICILKFTTSGPFGPSLIDGQVNVCKRNWWQPLLYVQNYVDSNAICMGHTWYLATEMQLFWLSPIIIIPMYKWPKLGNIFLGFLIFAFTILAFIISYSNSYNAVTIFNFSIGNYFRGFYVPTHTRAVPFLFGIGLGYMLSVNHRKRIVMNKFLVAITWVLAGAVLMYVVFGQYQFLQDGFKTTRFGNTAFLVLHRVAWAIGVCWVIFACIHGYGGPVNTFLSASVFQVLAKLSYCMYLVHFPLLYARQATLKSVPYFTNMNTFHLYWGDLFFAMLIAMIWTLAIEIPFGKLEMMLINGQKKSSTVVKRPVLINQKSVDLERDRSIEIISKF